MSGIKEIKLLLSGIDQFKRSKFMSFYEFVDELYHTFIFSLPRCKKQKKTKHVLYQLRFVFNVSALCWLMETIQGKDMCINVSLPPWLWPLCRHTSLWCLFQSDTWAQTWFPLHLRSKWNQDLFFFTFDIRWQVTVKRTDIENPIQLELATRRKMLSCMFAIDQYSLCAQGWPKCRKIFPSFLSMLSWSLLRSSWYCCCLILVTMYSASCKGKRCKVVTQTPDYQHHLVVVTTHIS